MDSDFNIFYFIKRLQEFEMCDNCQHEIETIDDSQIILDIICDEIIIQEVISTELNLCREYQNI